MCEFKALHLNPSEQHAELSEREFFDFYEVQNLKWREVRRERGRGRGGGRERERGREREGGRGRRGPQRGVVL